MATRNLNKVMLIGNLTRDPELRYTPQGTAVCTFGLATNRTWVTETGEKKEDVEFHRIVAWNKLAELCSQLLTKGRKVYVEGRLQTRTWTGQDGVKRSTTEVVISEMIILDSRGYVEEEDVEESSEEETKEEKKSADKQEKTETGEEEEAEKKEAEASTDEDKKEKDEESQETKEDVPPEDIPF